MILWYNEVLPPLSRLFLNMGNSKCHRKNPACVLFSCVELFIFGCLSGYIHVHASSLSKKKTTSKKLSIKRYFGGTKEWSAVINAAGIIQGQKKSPPYTGLKAHLFWKKLINKSMFYLFIYFLQSSNRVCIFEKECVGLSEKHQVWCLALFMGNPSAVLERASLSTDRLYYVLNYYSIMYCI